MGRSNGALAQHDPLEALAQWLDALRQGAGMSWGQLARKVSERGLAPSESTLYRAVKRKTLPKWETVQAFTQVCGGAEHKAKKLWTAADRHAAGRSHRALRSVPLPPQLITEPWQLIQAMNHRRRANGNPPLRELQARAYVDAKGTASHLPKSTLGAALQGRMPPKALLRHFVRCCGSATEDEVAQWEAAWERAHAHLRGVRLPEESAGQKTTRLQAELAEAYKRLAQAKADLARTLRTPYREPALVADPLPETACSPLGRFHAYLRPVVEDWDRGVSFPTARCGEPGGGQQPGQRWGVPGGQACDGPETKPGLPTRAAQPGPAAVIPMGKGRMAVHVLYPRIL